MGSIPTHIAQLATHTPSKLTLSQKQKNMQFFDICIFFRFWESVIFCELQEKMLEYVNALA